MDVFTPRVRSAIMASVRSQDMKPELTVRRLAHRLGYRFRLHRRTLPGTPDSVFPSRRRVIFVNGCFWHGHHCARGARLPRSNREILDAEILPPTNGALPRNPVGNFIRLDGAP